MTEIPFMYEILEFVEGSDIDRLPPASRRGATVIVGETLAQMHEIAVDGFGSITAAGAWSHTDGRASLLDTYVAADLARYAPKILRSGEIELVHDVLRRDELRIDQARLTHGDVAANDFDEFARSFMEGYTHLRPIGEEDMRRMKLLQVLTLFWSSCWHLAAGWNHREPLGNLRSLLDELDLRSRN
jgi:Ser/Thr protein kinase RdoA (MazF antagonist)